MIGFVAPFQILDYLDRLNVVKETSCEYHCTCPVCGDGGFKIDKKDGKYQGFKCGCEVKEIREAIRPWDEVKGQRKNISSRRKSTNLEIKLAQLDSSACKSPAAEHKPIPDWLVKQGVPASAIQTRYWYSKTQWVSRFEWQKESGLSEKTIRQGHIKSNGLIEWKKGSKDWRAYKLSEATKYCQGKWVLGVEGEGCVETARNKAIAGITWQGSNWQISRIVKDVTKLIEAGAAGLVYFPDYDETGSKKAELVRSACEQVNLPCLVLSPTDVWAEMPEKGDITDWVEAHPKLSTKQLIAKLDSAMAIALRAPAKLIAAKVQKQSKSKRESEKQLENLPNWSQSDVAEYLAEKYQTQLAWNTDLQEWYHYGSVTPGIWSKGSTERIGKLVKSNLKAIANKIAKVSKKKRDSTAGGFPSAGDCRKKPNYTISFINGVTALLKYDLEVDKWDESEGLLPLLNGVLDLETRKLLPHSPENKLTWCLPYEYNPFATCDPIQKWLLTMCGGDRNLVQLMRAYLLGIVTGRTDWQKYLELVGAGGTGKSTFTRAATALVGIENVHTTTLKKLEKSKFESASIAGKRLVLINDSERYAGEVGKLKNLTGQDSLPYEVKFKQSKGGFSPSALVIVSTNEVIQSCDYTSGLARRRISVPMYNQIPSSKQKNLIEQKNGKMYGEFLSYIPGLLNWVLEMDEESATSIVKNYEVQVPSLLAMKAKTLVETNPIADWLDNFVIYQPDAKTNVGVAKRDKDSNSPSWYLDTDKWLYANYCEYCHNSGTKAVSLRRFVTLLSDLGKNQLGLNIRRERDRFGSYFVGLKLRSSNDDSAPMITGNTEVKSTIIADAKPKTSSTNVVNKLWTMAIAQVLEAIDRVINKNVDVDEIAEDNTEKKEPPEEFVEPSSSDNQIDPEPKVESSQKFKDLGAAIVVGDLVTVENCPGHWLWASPFIVEAIDGEWAKLDMAEERVEVSRLSLIVHSQTK